MLRRGAGAAARSLTQSLASLALCCRTHTPFYPPPFRPLVLPVQVSDLQYNTIANGHGPIIRYNVEALVDDYKTWSLAVEKGATQVRGRGGWLG